MDYTNTVVTNIFKNKLWKMVNQRVASDITRLDADDVNGAYNDGAETFELDSIDDLVVDNIETELDESITQVEGELFLDVTLKGFKEFNGEIVNAGYYPLKMVYHFVFEKNGNKYENISFEYLD